MTYRGPTHRGARRTIAVVTYALTGAITVAAIAAIVWLGAVTIHGAWAYALTRM